jgi:hypothetical protein
MLHSAEPPALDPIFEHHGDATMALIAPDALHELRYHIVRTFQYLGKFFSVNIRAPVIPAPALNETENLTISSTFHASCGRRSVLVLT